MDKLRTTPRFSLNKLAEYLVATPRRRRRLILDQIKPAAFKSARYDEARRVLQQFLCDPSGEPASLFRSAARLRDRAVDPDVDEFKAKCLVDSARAIEAFVPIAEDVRYDGVVLVPGKRRDASLTIGDVRITICPDISMIDPPTEDQVGGIKFHFSRTNALGTEALRYCSTLLFSHVKNIGGRSAATLCSAVDIFSASCESAPRAVKRRMADVEAACEEIAERWPSLLTQVKERSVVE